MQGIVISQAHMQRRLTRLLRFVATAGLAATTVVALLGGTLAEKAMAAQSASITAKFAPERLGRHTTTTLAFKITASQWLPSPLTAVDFAYPRNLGIATSDLGTATCPQTALQERGPGVCPPNSIMGRGTVSVEVPLGPEVVPETASIALVAGTFHSGGLNLLVAATGTSPVAARIVMPTSLQNGHFHIAVPLVESLPEGPDVAVVGASVTLGGDLTYYARRGGNRFAYHPKGALLPPSCPRGGFRFAATFTFLDGSRASARATVGCPRRG